MRRDVIKPCVPRLPSLNAGYVDTSGFVALQRLFTAHVTGHFVTLGASLVQGSSGVVAKLLALPVCCAAIVLARLATTSCAAPAAMPRPRRAPACAGPASSSRSSPSAARRVRSRSTRSTSGASPCRRCSRW
jgi:Protein of unknown function (DUF1275)